MDNFIQFELVKLFDTWKKSRNNKYSNTDIQVYHDYFREFYKKLRDLAPNIDSLDLTQKQFLRFYIEYFQNRINCLIHRRHWFTQMLPKNFSKRRCSIGSARKIN